MTHKILIILTLFGLLFCRMAANPVDEQTARQIASKVMELSAPLQADVLPLHVPHASETLEPAYYVFTGTDRKGFAIVSAEDAVAPILAYAPDARIEEMPDNMLAWLEHIGQQIQHARQIRLRPSEAVRQQWNNVSLHKDVVLLQTAQWGQNAPYNDECPSANGQHAVTGCVATAYAILMKYYEYPLQGRGITKDYYAGNLYVPSRDLEHTYDWKEMPLSFDQNSSDAARKEVARLMADIGAAFELAYGLDGTAGSLGKWEVFKHFDYAIGNTKYRNQVTDEEWNATLQAELDRKRPVLYRGENSGEEYGHAFILDGYTSDGYYHVNWGWSGSYNGYFLLNALGKDDWNYSDNQSVKLCFAPMPDCEEEGVAQVGEVVCPDLNTALAAADMTGQEVKMLADVTIDEVYVNDGADVTLNLNGKTIVTKNNVIVDGTLTVEDRENKGTMVTTGNNSLFSVYHELRFNGGNYRHDLESIGNDETDYRRLCWVENNAKLVIDDGTFNLKNSSSQMICARGNLTINNGQFECHDDAVLVYGKGRTCINGGHFESDASQRILNLYGDAEINGGEFTTYGNAEVVALLDSLGVLTINAGKFVNACTKADLNDWRRALWTTEGSATHIRGGVFLCQYGAQCLCFNGDADIQHAVVDAPQGSACLTNATMTIQGSKICGTKSDLYRFNSNAQISVLTGLFSSKVSNNFLAPGSVCNMNTDPETFYKYGYVVTNADVPDAINEVEVSANTASNTYYSPDGRKMPAPVKGVNLVQDKQGRVRKIIRK